MIIKQQLIDEIQHTVNDWEADRIDLIFQALYRSELENLLSNSILPLWNNAGERQTILSILMNTIGRYDEKIQFSKDIGNKNFIIEKEIFDKNVKKPILTWFDDDSNGYAYRAFINLCNLAGSSVGAGEIALSLFCPQSEHTGRSSTAGDITLFNKKLEVKAKVTESSHGGRLHDQAKAEYEWSRCRSLFEELGFPFKEVSLSQFIKEIRHNLSDQDKYRVADAVIDANFRHIKDNSSDVLRHALVHETSDVIKNEWAFLGFQNYKNYAEFDGMLFIDVYHRLTIYVEDLKEIKDLVRINTVKIFGKEREAMPQITIKLS